MKNPQTVPLLAFVALTPLLGTGCEKDKNNQPTPPRGAPQERRQTGEPAEKELTSTPPPQPTATPTARAHMKEHLEQADRLREAVERGQLDESRAAAAWLAEHELTPRLAVSWKPHVERMQAAAVSARDADDLKAASVAIGRLGEACASCHREIRGPQIQVSAPPEGADLQAQMGLHAWAAQRMWLGLMAPSDEAWERGAEAMARAELTPEILFPDRSPDPEILVLEQQVQRIAGESRMAKKATSTDTSRGEAYASLLATCSACHTAMAQRRSEGG